MHPLKDYLPTLAGAELSHQDYDAALTEAIANLDREPLKEGSREARSIVVKNNQSDQIVTYKQNIKGTIDRSNNDQSNAGAREEAQIDELIHVLGDKIPNRKAYYNTIKNIGYDRSIGRAREMAQDGRLHNPAAVFNHWSWNERKKA